MSNNASEGFIKLLAKHARGVIVTGVSPAMIEGFAAAKVLVEGLHRAAPNTPHRDCAMCWKPRKSSIWVD